MDKKYYLLLILMFVFGIGVVFVLIDRVGQADDFFEYQRQQKAESFTQN